MRILVSIIVISLVITGCQAGTASAPVPADIPTPTPAAAVLTQPAGSTPKPAPVASATPASALGVSAADLRGVQLAFWHPWSGDLAKEVEAAVSEFNQSNIWGITVSVTGLGSVSALDAQLSDGVKKKSLPGVVAVPPENIAHLQQSSSTVVDLKPYYTDVQWGLSAQETSDFFPVFWQEIGPGAVSYSFPALRTMPVLVYNQTWAKELGFSSPPIFPADFGAQSCAAAKANRLTYNPDLYGTGGWIVDTSSPVIYSWLAAGGGIPNQLPQDALVLDNSTNQATFATLRKLFDDNCIWTSRNPTPFAYFAQRQALFYSATVDELPTQASNLAQQKSSDQWTVLAYPTDRTEQKIQTFGTSFAVLKASPAQQLAGWLFIRWMTLPRIQARLAAAGSVLPVRISALDLMADYKNANPQWSQAAAWLDRAGTMPVQSWWRIEQRVLEDAAWQIFQPFTKAGQIPDILQELDSTSKELLSNQ